MCQHAHDAGKLSATRRNFLSSLVPAAILARRAFAQQPQNMAARFRAMSEDFEHKGLAAPYKGITTDGNIVPGLYPIESTGVSTAAVRAAAEKFLAALTPAQRAKTMFAIDDPEWRKWMNQHFYVRQGVSLKELDNAQRAAAFGLLQASLSDRGFELTRNIMRLNETLAELSNDHEFLGEWLYYFTVMGKPSATEPWGFQLDGHHAIVNYFVLGDQVVMTPHFFGSEPVSAPSGKYKGLTILQEEQNQGLAFLKSLSEESRKKAILDLSKTGNNNLTEAFKDNVVINYAGVKASELHDSRQARLLDLAELYIGNMDKGHAKIKMAEVKRHLPETRFSWIGGTAPDSVFYYRIHSPVVLIEFDHQRPANLAQFAADRTKVTQQHIHCVVRTPNGNDYGKDLLREHHLKHNHA